MKTHQHTVKTVDQIQIVRHAHVCQKLQISSAKLFDLVAQGIFPKPFPIVPGGRAVGWIERDVNAWVLERKASASEVETILEKQEDANKSGLKEIASAQIVKSFQAHF